MSNISRGGPKTALGKRRSSQNAWRHGLFAEFSLSAADEAKFNKLSSDFVKILKPENALLDILCQDVVDCEWRKRIAFRFEQRELQKLFAAENEESDEKPQGVGECFPYGVKARQRGQVIKLLDYLRAQVETRRLPPDLEEPVTQACGADFWKALAEWAPLPASNSPLEHERASGLAKPTVIFIRCCKRAIRCRNFCSSRAAQVFRMAFVMDRKLFAGVNAILRISSSELNRRLMIKSARTHPTAFDALIIRYRK